VTSCKVHGNKERQMKTQREMERERRIYRDRLIEREEGKNVR